VIVNLQRKIKIDTKQFTSFVSNIIEFVQEAESREFSIAFVSDKRMTELNKFFRNKNSTTDVLSFPHEPDEFDADNNGLGDIVISVEQAQKQAAENGLTLEGEIKQLILHGVLHLCGYDHEIDNGEMNKIELKLRKRLKI